MVDWSKHQRGSSGGETSIYIKHPVSEPALSFFLPPLPLISSPPSRRSRRGRRARGDRCCDGDMSGGDMSGGDWPEDFDPPPSKGVRGGLDDVSLALQRRLEEEMLPLYG